MGYNTDIYTKILMNIGRSPPTVTREWGWEKPAFSVFPLRNFSTFKMFVTMDHKNAKFYGGSLGLLWA